MQKTVIFMVNCTIFWTNYSIFAQKFHLEVTLTLP